MTILGLALAGGESSGSNMRQPAVTMPGPAVNMAGPADLSDLVDARGSGGETQLLSRGFVLARHVA